MCNKERYEELFRKEKNQILLTIMQDDVVERFRKLLRVRGQVDPEAYATCVRMVIQDDTTDVPLEMFWDVLDGLSQKDLMYQSELLKLEKLPCDITIYRGTDYKESEPRISWSLDRNAAMRFCRGRLFEAKVNKQDIYAYFSVNCDEEEIIVHVKKENIINNIVIPANINT